MKKLIIGLLLTGSAYGQQSQPQGPPPITPDRIVAEFGRLQLQYNALLDYVASMQQRITILEKENKELKDKLDPKKPGPQ